MLICLFRGKYKITASSGGFAEQTKGDIEFRAGEAASLDFSLSPQGSVNAVIVLGTTEGVQSDSAELGTRLDLQKIDDTPFLGRKLPNLVGVKLGSSSRTRHGRFVFEQFSVRRKRRGSSPDDL